ncbi:hypothetical protein [Algisphaera agarilytica]|uniref:HEAT repeat-containing protein n=1 Tax=Algisphaera agarilytica TaxID=1385975 RepID=A0A7X0H301_9BACT|nr:hypothetical protein [Algisphaera agarilytica]MBB6428333.1 hypothetical protein [Algisphaera agarilytica]
MRRGRALGAVLCSAGLLALSVPETAAAETRSAPTSEDSPVPPSSTPALVPDRETTQQAILLFNDAVTVQADGRHNRLLRALRHLEAPELGPLFVGLSRADHPSLRVHGMLGIAELNQPRGLTPSDIATVPRPDVQAELISAALDGELIDPPTRLALLGWQGLDPGVKLLLSSPLVAAGDFDKDSPGYADLLEALDDPALGKKGLAGLLLTQLGNDQGKQVLADLRRSTHPSAQAAQATLLETAWSHGLNGCADWAYSIATTPDLPPRLEMLALKVAIRFGDRRADAWWSERWSNSEDITFQTRLAWVGLEAAPWMDAERFEPLIDSEDELVAQLGRTAQAISMSRNDTAEFPEVETRVINLIETNHPLACRWATRYAQDIGSAEFASAVVLRTEPGEPRGRARRLDAVVRSTQTLIELEPIQAKTLIVTALQSETVEPAWQRGVLLGLIRSRSDEAREIVQELPAFSDLDTQALALVLRLQSPEPLTEEQTQTLSRVIRGGAELDDSLRIQLAWTYLQQTGQGQEAIAAVLAQP